MQWHERSHANPQHGRHQHRAQRAALTAATGNEWIDQCRNTQHEEDIGNVGADDITKREAGTAFDGSVERYDHFRRGRAEPDDEYPGNQWRNTQAPPKRDRAVDQKVAGEGHNHEPPYQGGNQGKIGHFALASLIETLEFDEIQDAENEHDRADGYQGGMDHYTVSLFCSSVSVSIMVPSIARVVAIGEPHSTRYRAPCPTFAHACFNHMPAFAAP